MMTTETKSVWELAEMAGCDSPESDISPGAMWLVRVASDLSEVIGRVTEYGEDTQDVIRELADAAVPVYTHEMWRVFVDLAAYDVDDEGLHDREDDMTQRAMVALYVVAERLLNALVGEVAS
jgi:hypothetical protein